MPISLASNVTASRILSASRPSVVSASGSEALVKILLKNQLRRDLIANAPARTTAHAGSAQGEPRVLRRMALVATGDRQAEAALELPREAQRPCRHGVGRAIGMRRQPDDQQHRSPFLDQCADRLEALAANRCSDRRQRMRDANP